VQGCREGEEESIVSRKPGRGRGPSGPQQGQQGAPRPQQAGQQQKSGPGWGPVRDSIRRDVELALSSLAFAERLHEALDNQRRLFIDFPRVLEELRSGALERLAGALERIYEGQPGSFDLGRFLRDLPLALSHLAAVESQARRLAAPPAAAKAAGAPAEGGAEAAVAPAAAATEGAAAEAAPAEAAHAAEAAPEAEAPAAEAAPADGAAEQSAAAPAEAPAAEVAVPAAEAAAPVAEAAVPADGPKAGAEGPVSPRVELRHKMLTAAPHLSKAAQSFRRNAATVRRAAAPRRQPGPWRSDREVLEQARRAVEFAEKAYETYAEAWADSHLPRSLAQSTAAEVDRFLAWTQLTRYTEVARAGSPHVAPKTHEAAPGVKVQGEKAEQPAAEAAAAEAPPPAPAAAPAVAEAAPQA
jgi:hypothetical protein